MEHARYCTWCHEPLPALPDDASYVDELNHTMHDHCRDERDAFVKGRDSLLAAIGTGTSAPVPQEVKDAYLESIRARGLTRRCPCLYDGAYGFRGNDTHTWGSEDGSDYDERNAVSDCRPCAGTGNHDQLPELLEMTDADAARWIQKKILRGCGPLRGHESWQYSTLERDGDGRPIAGVVLYNVILMLGGIVTWAEIAQVFRPRLQQAFF